MTVFQKIIKAIQPFGYPHEPDLYEGTEERYFVYNYADERGVLFGDEDVESITASIQVHFFLPRKENFIEIKNQIRRALFCQGTTYPEVTVLIEKEKRHIIFECDIEEDMEE